MNPYQVLGVDKTATKAEIKSAYKKLAKLYHPDVNDSPEALAKFQEITAAYEILGDDSRRRDYDNPRPSFSGFQHNQDDLSEILRQFGFAMNGGGRQRQVITLDKFISLEQNFSGVKLPVNIKSNQGNISFDLDVPPGAPPGFSRTIENNGCVFVVRVGVHQHPIFQRDRNNLICNVRMDVFDVILQSTFEVETIDKKRIQVKVPKNTQFHSILRVPGMGMPIMGTSNRGDMLIQIEFDIPDLTDDQRQAIRQIRNNP